ncbi:hypothetical protein J4411_03410 [Candidatus Pacearchaeota archaeon]|nr:hypothetical protein [Candidatus Pacearchaeota archaeon]
MEKLARKKYTKEVTRFYNLEKIKAWNIGEFKYLPKIIGAGFKNTIFVSNNGAVEFYYDSKEVEIFEKALESEIGEKEFDKICTDFMFLIFRLKNSHSDRERLKLFSKMVPALTIFNEFDEYPDYLEGEMGEALMKVRTATHSEPYDLLRNIGIEEPKNFIYFKGKVYPLAEF